MQIELIGILFSVFLIGGSIYYTIGILAADGIHTDISNYCDHQVGGNWARALLPYCDIYGGDYSYHVVFLLWLPIGIVYYTGVCIATLSELVLQFR